MTDQTINTIKQPPAASVDYTELTDEDLRQLAIHYATLIRKPGPVKISPIVDTWRAWPPELRDRFYKLIWDEAAAGNYFWSRPADNNIRWGIDN